MPRVRLLCEPNHTSRRLDRPTPIATVAGYELREALSGFEYRLIETVVARDVELERLLEVAREMGEARAFNRSGARLVLRLLQGRFSLSFSSSIASSPNLTRLPSGSISSVLGTPWMP